MDMTPSQTAPPPPQSALSASSLIQSLDDALQSMTDLTSSAENDAENARRNARMAMEVAQEHSTQIYNKKLDALRSMDTKRGTPNHHHQARPPPPPPPPPVPQDARPKPTPDPVSHSIELQKCRQLLKNTTTSLQNERLKISQLEQSLKLKNDSLSELRHRVSVAEEDANMAYDLAKTSAGKREEVESYLRKALDEITSLKAERETLMLNQAVTNAAAATSLVTVHEDDNNTTDGSVSSSIASVVRRERAGVAVGRGILQRYTNGSHKRLRHAMEKNDKRMAVFHRRDKRAAEDVNTADQRQQRQQQQRDETLFQILKKSAERLDLKMDNQLSFQNGEAAEHNKNLDIDVVARAFCQAVEKQFNHQNQQLKELESYCDYLETNLRKK